jgi:hypothetical protein
MAVFLTEATDRIDRVLTDEDRSRLAQDLARAMDNAARLFGEHAFRKWPAGQDDRRSPINLPLLEAWSVVLASHGWDALEPHRAKIVDGARRAMAEDRELVEAISVGTGDPARVKARFERVKAILETALS